MPNLSSMKEWALDILSKRNTLKGMIDRDELVCHKKDKRKTKVQGAINVLSYLSDQKHGKIVQLFENTITSALQDVFDDSYKFRFNFKKNGNSMGCTFEVINKDLPKFLDIKMSRGNSVKEIIALFLRIILVKIHSELSSVVIVDEPLRGLNVPNQEVVADYLKKLARMLDLQMIFVDLGEAMSTAAENVIEVRR